MTASHPRDGRIAVPRLHCLFLQWRYHPQGAIAARTNNPKLEREQSKVAPVSPCVTMCHHVSPASSASWRIQQVVCSATSSSKQSSPWNGIPHEPKAAKVASIGRTGLPSPTTLPGRQSPPEKGMRLASPMGATGYQVHHFDSKECMQQIDTARVGQSVYNTSATQKYV